MQIVLNGQEFEVNNRPNLNGDLIGFSLSVSSSDEIPFPISGDVILKDVIIWPKTGVIEDDDELANGVEEEFVLYQTTVEKWLRYYISENTLFFTNIPEPDPITPPTPEEMAAQKAAQIRRVRDSLISETDWTQLLDAPISDESREYVRVYRQELRDIPQQESFPDEVIWPEKPDVIKGVSDPVDTAVAVLVGGEK